jgi:predicted transcriptional regulator
MAQGDDRALVDWQIEETRRALSEADRGEFASNKEVRQTLKKWLAGGQLKTKQSPRAKG